jgi:hypothetical protein
VHEARVKLKFCNAFPYVKKQCNLQRVKLYVFNKTHDENRTLAMKIEYLFMG